MAKDGRVRLELQAEKGDTQVLYDGHTLTVYDASSNTLYRYTPPAGKGGADTQSTDKHEVPSVAKIEEAIAKLDHVNVSGATPTDIAGQPAYTARVSPKESGSLIGGAELSWDANNGLPLRAALYSSTSSSPVIELAASEVSYGPVERLGVRIHPPPARRSKKSRCRASTRASQRAANTASRTSRRTATASPASPSWKASSSRARSPRASPKACRR